MTFGGRTWLPVCALLAVVALGEIAAADEPARLQLQTRSRTELPDHPGKYTIAYKTVDWDPAKTAVISRAAFSVTLTRKSGDVRSAASIISCQTGFPSYRPQRTLG